jgi:integrase/recombinase XerC
VSIKWQEIVDDFIDYLHHEKNRSPNTLRTYRTDIESLLEYSESKNLKNIQELDLTTIRSWIAVQSTNGAAAASIARRTSSVRIFTKWLAENNITKTDPGSRLLNTKSPQVITAGAWQSSSRKTHG